MPTRDMRPDADYYGLPARTLANAYIRADYLAEAGPRLVRLVALRSRQPENLLAETPDLGWPTPYGHYYLRGGHRLWHAPEGQPRSSIPDSGGLQVEDLGGGVRLIGPTEAPTGIAKSMEIRLCPDRAALTLVHSLRNDNLWPLELAPWAITQLKLGGVVVLPQPPLPVDAGDRLPNRHLALWPYASVRDPRLELYDDLWLVHGRGQRPPCKIGGENRLGWVAYVLGDAALVRRFRPQLHLPHPDRGCNMEVYLDDAQLELEVLGPLCRLEPGETVRHVERWEIHTGLSVEPTLDGVRQMVEALGPQLGPLAESELDAAEPDSPGPGNDTLRSRASPAAPGDRA
jgi:hypothetical protein